MSTKTKQDLIISVVLYIAIGYFLYLTAGLMADSAVFPRMVLMLMAVINTINVIQVIMKDKQIRDTEEANAMLSWKEAKMPLLTFIGATAYVILFMSTNYFIATVVMIPVFMLIEKIKPVWLIAVITAVYLGFIYWLFVIQLSVRLIR